MSANAVKYVSQDYALLNQSKQQEMASSALRTFHEASMPAARFDAALSIGHQAARNAYYRETVANALPDVRKTLLEAGEAESGVHRLGGERADTLRWEEVRTRVYDSSEMARGRLGERGEIQTYNIETVANNKVLGRVEGMTLQQVEGLVGRDNAANIAAHVGETVHNMPLLDASPANVFRVMSSGTLSGTNLHGGVVPSERLMREAVSVAAEREHSHPRTNLLPASYAEALPEVRRTIGNSTKLFIAQEDQNYTGPIVYMNDKVAAQDTRDGKVVLHDVAKLSHNVSEHVQTISTMVQSLAGGAPLAIAYAANQPPQLQKHIEPSRLSEQSRENTRERGGIER